MFILSDKTYNFSKKLVQVIIPAISSLYFGLSAIWGLPAAEQVVGTLAVLATFLGVCLGISTKEYEKSGQAYDGKIVVGTGESGRKLFSLEIEGDPEELEKKSSVTFKIDPRQSVDE